MEKEDDNTMQNMLSDLAAFNDDDDYDLGDDYDYDDA